MDLCVKCAIVFQVDGLNLEGVKEDLSKYGEITEIEDNKLDDDTPVKVIFMTLPFGKYFRLTLDYNCAYNKSQPYLLYPMASIYDKLQLMQWMKEAN